MLFTLSSSLLLLVAGSTVRAAPQFGSGLLVENEDGKVEVAPSSQSVLTTLATSSQHSSSMLSSSTHSVLTTSVASSSHASSTHSAVATQTTFGTITSAAKLTTGAASLTTISAFITGKNGKLQATTFAVPISTPSASHQTSLALASVTSAAAVSAKATITPSVASTGSNGTSLASGSKCDGTNDGAVVCSSDGTLFGLCNYGSVVMQPVSKGTACRDGSIDYIADVLGVALDQIKTYLDSNDNSTNVFGTADPQAIDAADCPSVLLYLKDTVDAADGTDGSGSTTTGLKFTKTAAGKTVIVGSNPQVELVKSAAGAASFQVQHECGGSATSATSMSRRSYIDIAILSGFDDF